MTSYWFKLLRSLVNSPPFLLVIVYAVDPDSIRYGSLLVVLYVLFYIINLLLYLTLALGYLGKKGPTGLLLLLVSAAGVMYGDGLPSWFSCLGLPSIFSIVNSFNLLNGWLNDSIDYVSVNVVIFLNLIVLPNSFSYFSVLSCWAVWIVNYAAVCFFYIFFCFTLRSLRRLCYTPYFVLLVDIEPTEFFGEPKVASENVLSVLNYRIIVQLRAVYG